MHNNFRPYNKSLLINMFMSNEWKSSVIIRDNIDNINISFLHWVCKKEKLNTLRLLFQQEPNININAILIYSVLSVKTQVARLLLKHPNINVNIADKFGDTPLISACAHNFIELVNLLVNHPDINVNQMSNNGSCPLIYVCDRKYIEILKLLLQHPKINVNILQPDIGVSSLIVACYNNDTEIAKLLLQHPDIDINIKDNDGYTALDYAKKNGNQELISLLKSYGAQ